MPLRDHFRPPISKESSWEGLHGMWPATMVQELSKALPKNYAAEPRVHLGTYFEIDVCAYEEDAASRRRISPDHDRSAVTTATWAPPEPTLTLNADLTEQYAYEVLIFDRDRGRELVAAVEIVSPANKDRPENRQAFVAKCVALLQNRICISIVDLVTTRRFDLYAELLAVIGESDPTFGPIAPATYAVTCRGRKVDEKPRLETWAYPLVVGQILPILPIWLTKDLAVSLDLETCYEEACRVLRIGVV